MRHGRSTEVRGSGEFKCPEVAARGRVWPNSTKQLRRYKNGFDTVPDRVEAVSYCYQYFIEDAISAVP
jgi:hypothetical protein